MGIILFLSSVISPLRTYLLGNWDTSEDLPLLLCGISALILSILPFLKNKGFLFDFVFYTGIIGGIMGVLTPQMSSYDGSIYVYFLCSSHSYFYNANFLPKKFGFKAIKKIDVEDLYNT